MTWFDVRTGATIARSPQPLVGMHSKRSADDEKLIRELAHLTYKELNDPMMQQMMNDQARAEEALNLEGPVSMGREAASSGRRHGIIVFVNVVVVVLLLLLVVVVVVLVLVVLVLFASPGNTGHRAAAAAGAAAPAVLHRRRTVQGRHPGQPPHGQGVEQVKYYRDSKYAAGSTMNIGNIHSARESVDTADALPPGGDGETAPERLVQQIDSTGWLGHVHHILKASNFVVEVVSQRCGVLRTAATGGTAPQLCCLAQLPGSVLHSEGLHVLVEGVAVVRPQVQRPLHAWMQQPSEERSPVFTFPRLRLANHAPVPTIFEFNEVRLYMHHPAFHSANENSCLG